MFLFVIFISFLTLSVREQTYLHMNFVYFLLKMDNVFSFSGSDERIFFKQIYCAKKMLFDLLRKNSNTSKRERDFVLFICLHNIFLEKIFYIVCDWLPVRHMKMKLNLTNLLSMSFFIFVDKKMSEWFQSKKNIFFLFA